MDTQFDDIQTNAGQALQDTDFMAIAAVVGFENKWLLFKAYLDAVAQACADATEPKWIDRLGGADVFTFDHCWMMLSRTRFPWTQNWLNRSVQGGPEHDR